MCIKGACSNIVKQIKVILHQSTAFFLKKIKMSVHTGMFESELTVISTHRFINDVFSTNTSTACRSKYNDKKDQSNRITLFKFTILIKYDSFELTRFLEEMSDCS